MAHSNIHRWEYHHYQRAQIEAERARIAEQNNPHSNYWREMMFDERDNLVPLLGSWDKYLAWVDANIPYDATFRDTALAIRKEVRKLAQLAH